MDGTLCVSMSGMLHLINLEGIAFQLEHSGQRRRNKREGRMNGARRECYSNEIKAEKRMEGQESRGVQEFPSRTERMLNSSVFKHCHVTHTLGLKSDVHVFNKPTLRAFSFAKS